MTSPTERVLALLKGVRQTGAGRWIACCPAHDDRRPSLSIREGDDGRVLLYDFGGCGNLDILDALNLEWSSLFPKLPKSGPNTAGKPRRAAPPIPAKDALSILNEEALVVSFIALRLEQGEPTEPHREHLHRAASRINAIRELWMSAP